MRFRDVEISLKTPKAPGTISAFFLYQLDQSPRNDEIDIEILNDGSKQILFTTWVGGKQTNHAKTTLGFDPTKGFHTYRIEWSPRRVGFLVDHVLIQEFTTGVPQRAMYVMSNTWWPTWLPEDLPEGEEPPQLHKAKLHEIDQIVY